jgi:uncharacterized membrane protein YgcG
MQPHPLTSVMQFAVAAAALCVAAAAIFFAVSTVRQERNAALVSIGVSVLRADPGKEAQVNAARQWALDLIDANAGGVKFSTDARAALLRGPLITEGGGYDGGGDNGAGAAGGTDSGGGPARRRR